jgi:GNAT superfamily N-acetyltransferase
VTDLRIEVVPYTHPDAVTLTEEVQQEYIRRYGGRDKTPVDPDEFAPPKGLFLVGYHDDKPVTCGGWRAHGEEAEIKRMYVRSSARGAGFARAVLAALERTARQAGHRRMILETGLEQPEAIALYRSAGYADAPAFGYYACTPLSIHLGKDL